MGSEMCIRDRTSTDPKVISSDVPTPAFYDGDFFILNKDRKVLSRVDPATGEIRWKSDRLPGNADYEASPLVADGKIYVMNFVSRIIVLDARTGEQLGDMTMDEARDDPTRASIVAAQGQLFVRTTTKLFCIAK